MAAGVRCAKASSWQPAASSQTTCLLLTVSSGEVSTCSKHSHSETGRQKFIYKRAKYARNNGHASVGGLVAVIKLSRPTVILLGYPQWQLLP